MQFEGSSLPQTIWKLEFPLGANPAGLTNVADILVTIDPPRAQFSPTLSVGNPRSRRRPPASQGSSWYLRASSVSPVWRTSRQACKGHPSVRHLSNRLAAAGEDSYPEQPRNPARRGEDRLERRRDGRLHHPFSGDSHQPGHGTAFSNSPPITDASSTSPTIPAQRPLGCDRRPRRFSSLMIDKTANASFDFTTVQDVIFGFDYTATY